MASLPSERGGWSEGYSWAFLVSQDPQSGEVGPSAASLLQDLWNCHHVSSLLAVPKRGPSLSGKVGGHWSPEAGGGVEHLEFKKQPR